MILLANEEARANERPIAIGGVFYPEGCKGEGSSPRFNHGKDRFWLLSETGYLAL